MSGSDKDPLTRDLLQSVQTLERSYPALGQAEVLQAAERAAEPELLLASRAAVPLEQPARPAQPEVLLPEQRDAPPSRTERLEPPPPPAPLEVLQPECITVRLPEAPGPLEVEAVPPPRVLLPDRLRTQAPTRLEPLEPRAEALPVVRRLEPQSTRAPELLEPDRRPLRAPQVLVRTRAPEPLRAGPRAGHDLWGPPIDPGKVALQRPRGRSYFVYRYHTSLIPVRVGLHDPTTDSYNAVWDMCLQLDWSWLQPDQKVFVKVACNSGEKHPAVTSPSAVAAVCDYMRKVRPDVLIYVGDQAGLEWVRRPEKHAAIGSTLELMESNGLLAAIKDAKATPVPLEFFPGHELAQYDDPKKELLGWGGVPPKVSAAAAAVDHIVYLPRLGSHSIAGFSGGLKCAVGWLDENSRLKLHMAGENFHRCYAEINRCRQISERLRLTLTLAEQTLLDFGPDWGTIYPESADGTPTLVIAAQSPLQGPEYSFQSLVRHDAVAWALYSFIRKRRAERAIPGFTLGALADHYRNLQPTSLITESIGPALAAQMEGLPAQWNLRADGALVGLESVLAYGDTYGADPIPVGKKGFIDKLTLAQVNRAFLLICCFIGAARDVEIPWPTWAWTVEALAMGYPHVLPPIPYQPLDDPSLAKLEATKGWLQPEPIAVSLPFGSVTTQTWKQVRDHLWSYKEPGFEMPYAPKFL